MITLPALLLVSSLLTPTSHAHKEHHTLKETEIQRALQAAAYHCAPAIEQFTAARKRSWAQKVLAGNPSLPGYDDLFAEGTYADEAPGGVRDVERQKWNKEERFKRVLSCVEERETRVFNRSCVLGMSCSVLKFGWWEGLSEFVSAGGDAGSVLSYTRPDTTEHRRGSVWAAYCALPSPFTSLPPQLSLPLPYPRAHPHPHSHIRKPHTTTHSS